MFSVGDRVASVRSSLGEYAVMVLMWGGLLLTCGVLFGAFAYFGYRITNGESIAGGVIIGLVLLLLLGILGGLMRSRNERAARATWWSRGWRDRF